ncbi:hypothetical protein B0H17DRAFT_1208823 [Mycena rosella]|uniref:Uncharacterized protein n=1 Tax=Mycena rosella TaxID=1033263 RepID=A0AAD7D3R9_MYCRO|nr:hypothetical protein B0H17DRAFT_1208823 [Mycena rosella]
MSSPAAVLKSGPGTPAPTHTNTISSTAARAGGSCGVWRRTASCGHIYSACTLFVLAVADGPNTLKASRSAHLTKFGQIYETTDLYFIFTPTAQYGRAAELLCLSNGTLDLFIAIEGDVFDSWKPQSALSPQLYHLYLVFLIY